MSQYISSITINQGLVTHVTFAPIAASDLPVSGVVPGGYASPNLVIDQFGRITSAVNGGGGSGTVTTVSIVSANGVSGSVANPTTTPAITITLGAITPTSVAASGTVTGSNLSGSSSGTNTGDQTITLTGDVTGSGSGSFAATIAANAVTYAKMQQASATTLLGNSTGGLANVQELTLGTGLAFSTTTIAVQYGTSSSTACVGNDARLSNARTPVGTALTSASIWVGSGSNLAAEVVVSGDVTITNAGVTAIGAAKVTNAMLAGSIAASKLVGTDIATVGTVASGVWKGALRGYIDGLVLSNDGGTPLTVLDIAAGQCSDSTNAFGMVLAAFTKNCAAAWASGTGNGGNFAASSLTNATWYHVFLIRKTSDGSIDAGIDTSITAANIPTGYGTYRRIGSILTDGSAHVIAFHQYGDEFYWDTSVLDVNAVSNATTAISYTLSVPSGLKVQAILNASRFCNSGNTGYIYLSSLDSVDLATSFTACIQSGQFGASATAAETFAPLRVWTNTTQQIRFRADTAGGGTNTNRIRTLGWLDLRGRNA